MTMTVDGQVIGLCIYGTEVGIIDFSRREREFDGAMLIIPRGYIEVINYKVEIKTTQVAQVRQLLASKRAIISDYVGSTEFEALNVKGYLGQFSITIDNWETSSLSLEVTEGEVQDVPLSVRFDLKGGTYTGGGSLTQTFTAAQTPYTATAPTLTPPTGKTHYGWDKSLIGITRSTTISAVYT